MKPFTVRQSRMIVFKVSNGRGCPVKDAMLVLVLGCLTFRRIRWRYEWIDRIGRLKTRACLGSYIFVLFYLQKKHRVCMWLTGASIRS